MGNFATTFVTAIHVLLCVLMIFVILLQPGKDAGMGAAFGGGAATSAFGGRGAVTFLSKLTAACAIFFFVTSLGLSFAGLHRSVVINAPPTGAPPTADAGVPSAAGAGTESPDQPAEEKKADALHVGSTPAPAPKKPAEPPKH
jgi:preprotein translocase subunit SecG